MPLTAFTNARLLDPASGRDEVGTVVTERDKITALGAGIATPEGAETIDCTGLCLAPGLVDMRVAVGEPGEEQRETILSASRAAATSAGAPVAESTRKLDTLLESPLVTNRNEPSGSIATPIGVLPPLANGEPGDGMSAPSALSIR